MDLEPFNSDDECDTWWGKIEFQKNVKIIKILKITMEIVKFIVCLSKFCFELISITWKLTISIFVWSYYPRLIYQNDE